MNNNPYLLSENFNFTLSNPNKNQGDVRVTADKSGKLHYSDSVTGHELILRDGPSTVDAKTKSLVLDILRNSYVKVQSGKCEVIGRLRGGDKKKFKPWLCRDP